MTSLLGRALARALPANTLDARDAVFAYTGNTYPTGAIMAPTGAGNREGGTATDYERMFRQVMSADGPVAACFLARRMLLSEARFVWQRIQRGRPTTILGSPELRILEAPWPNGSTGQLIARMSDYEGLAGNAFVVRRGEARLGDERLVLPRPDWMVIVGGSRYDDAPLDTWDLDAEVIGYLYFPGGPLSGRDPVPLLVDDVAHYAPNPDPLSRWRGMSWLTPVLREIDSDQAATDHKAAFFRNGASPAMVVSFDASIRQDQVMKMSQQLNALTQGTGNAYRTLYLGGGADVTVVGKDLAQLDFANTQGRDEPLAFDTRVPTPSGWTTMGEIKVGDEVLGRDGTPARVVAVSPVHLGRDCYRVTFADRTSIVADGSHVWSAIDRNTMAREVRDYTTVELRALIEEWTSRGNGGNRIGLPPAAPVKLPARDLLVDPYVLGAWLGDGQTAGAAICGAADDLAFVAAEIERRGYTVTRWATKPDKVPVIGIPGGLLAALDALGVLGAKAIPAEYLRASIEQRLDLLRGLMDTDGSIGHAGDETCVYVSKLAHLAEQVAELARSLGMRVTMTRRADGRSRTGEMWRVTFRADPGMVPFLLPRKAARCVTPLHVRNRAIVSIEPVESVPVRCIAVDTADHLFLAGDGWAVTHNTRISAAAGIHPVVLGLSEGLSGSSLNAGNFGAARRLTGDRTLRPLWRFMCDALGTIVPQPTPDNPTRGGGVTPLRLWIDERDIPFLREDMKDIAEAQLVRSQAIAGLVREGFDPDSVVSWADADDLTLLSHTGAVSVQLQKPGPDGSTTAQAPPQPAVGGNGQGQLPPGPSGAQDGAAQVNGNGRAAP